MAGIYPCNGYDLMAEIDVLSLSGSSAERGSDIWGWTDSQTNKEYALVGMSNGTSFVDISNPENPIFRDENINQQQRFITLIDVKYEQRISLAFTAETNLEKIGSSLKLISPFKRTISRLFELTSPNTKN